MGGWKLESFKMFTYLAFPIATFVYFNSTDFYTTSLKRTMELASKDVNFDNLARYEQLNSKQEINKLDSVIEDIEKS